MRYQPLDLTKMMFVNISRTKIRRAAMKVPPKCMVLKDPEKRQLSTAFEAVPLIKPPALRVMSDLYASDEVRLFLIQQFAHNAFFQKTHYENSKQRIVITYRTPPHP